MPKERTLKYALVSTVVLVLFLAIATGYFSRKSTENITTTELFTMTETQTQIQISRIVSSGAVNPVEMITQVVLEFYTATITIHASGNCTQGPGTIAASPVTTTDYVFPTFTNRIFNGTIVTVQTTNQNGVQESTTTVSSGVQLVTITMTNAQAHTQPYFVHYPGECNQANIVAAHGS
jgi:hypothetical protein